MAMPVVETTTMLSMSSFSRPVRQSTCSVAASRRSSAEAEIDAVALGPAVRAVVPFDRHAGVSPVYSGVQEYRQQAIEVRRAPEQELDAFDHVVSGRADMAEPRSRRRVDAGRADIGVNIP